MHSGSEAAAARPEDLLAWYDRHRRRLPWRAEPGEPAQPYRVWLSEIMLQQTTVAAVGPYYRRFLEIWPTVEALAAAPSETLMREWAGLGYYARARNLQACARAVVAEHDGRFPDAEEALRRLPGIGAYTAAAVAAIAFGRRAVVVDGNVERVVSRLFRLEVALPAAKPAIRALTDRLTPAERSGDFAQAMMDLGATICTPRRPACALCPWRAACAGHSVGDQERFPLKTPKKPRPLRRGAAFVLRRTDGALLVRRRPEKGLLGGMLEVPNSDWVAGAGLPEHPDDAPFPARWQRLPEPARQGFTHFELELAVFAAEAPPGVAPPPGHAWLPAGEIAGAGFPTVMRKVLAAAGLR